MNIECAKQYILENYFDGADNVKTIVVGDEETMTMKLAVEALEKQIPKKPKMDNDNGIYETEHCPNCNRKLFPNEHHCKCGQALDWSDSE